MEKKNSFLSLIYSFEIFCLIKMKCSSYKKKLNAWNDIDYCYISLNKVSRSFALVIEQLPEQIKDIICIFYLVLRGLDTIEDDMLLPSGDKINLLRTFHEKLSIRNWSIDNIGDLQDSKTLLNNFNKIINVFQSFDLKYQTIIIDITKQMADGMIEFIDSNGTIDQYNLYWHYVAGLVGHGLSQIFYQSHFQSKTIAEKQSMSNSMGLFLQKTNIIRDYPEDLQAGRIRWPKQIWMNYSSNIDYFGKHPTDDL